MALEKGLVRTRLETKHSFVCIHTQNFQQSVTRDEVTVSTTPAMRHIRIARLKVPACTCLLLLALLLCLHGEIKDFLSSLTEEQRDQLLVEAYGNTGGVQLPQSVLSVTTDIPHGDNQEGNNQPRCICNKCLNMDTSIENKCCRRTTCVTTTEPFETIVLDRDILSVAIVNRSDDFADEPDYSPSSYRKAAYRQWTMWQIGSTGQGNRRVIPSCVVRAVRNRYPAPDGIYLGYKEC